MKKIIVLLALVSFIGVQAAPVAASTSSYAVEHVHKEKKESKKAKKSGTDCDTKSSSCCDSKKECCDKKVKKDEEKK